MEERESGGVRESRREVKAGTEKIGTEEMDGYSSLVAGWPPNIGRGRIGGHGDTMRCV
jgi:hypothetical protein